MSFKTYVSGRSPDHHLRKAFWDNEFTLCIAPIAKILAAERDGHCLGLTFLEVDTFEAPEFLDGSLALVLGQAGIDLGDLIAVVFAGILQPERDLDGITLILNLEVGIAEGAVAQAITERIKDIPLEILVGSLGDVIIVKRRKILDSVVIGQRQPSGRIILAEKNLGHGCAALLTGVPGVDDGRKILVLPEDGERASCDQYQDDILVFPYIVQPSDFPLYRTSTVSHLQGGLPVCPFV